METLDRIFELVNKKGWSNSYFAKRLGKNVGITTDWKIGRSESYLKLLPKIAEILNTTEAYLRGDIDDPYPVNRKLPIKDGQPVDPAIAELWEAFEDLSLEEATKTLEYVQLLKLKRKT